MENKENQEAILAPYIGKEVIVTTGAGEVKGVLNKPNFI
jgi:hypothetical protein